MNVPQKWIMTKAHLEEGHEIGAGVLPDAPCSASDEIRRMVFAFDDHGRKQEVRRIAARVKKLEQFVNECRDDFDCDQDAHRYGTTCRACAAAELMPNDKLCREAGRKTHDEH